MKGRCRDTFPEFMVKFTLVVIGIMFAGALLVIVGMFVVWAVKSAAQGMGLV